MSNERDRARAQKRGGGRALIPLDVQVAETRYSLGPTHELTAERAFERRWALTVLERALERLRDAHVAADRTELFEELKGSLTGDTHAARYADIGERLGLSEGAVKAAAHRLRRNYRDLLRREIADTVASPDQIDDELRHLVSILSR